MKAKGKRFCWISGVCSEDSLNPLGQAAFSSLVEGRPEEVQQEQPDGIFEFGTVRSTITLSIALTDAVVDCGLIGVSPTGAYRQRAVGVRFTPSTSEPINNLMSVTCDRMGVHWRCRWIPQSVSRLSQSAMHCFMRAQCASKSPFFLILFNPLTIEPKTSFFLGFRTAEVPNGTFGSERSSKCGLTANQAISPLRGDLCVLRRQPFNRPFHRIENNIVALAGPWSTVASDPDRCGIASHCRSATHRLRSNGISIAFGLPGLRQPSRLENPNMTDDSAEYNKLLRRSQTSDQRAIFLGGWYGTTPLPIRSDVVQKGIDHRDQLPLCRSV